MSTDYCIVKPNAPHFKVINSATGEEVAKTHQFSIVRDCRGATIGLELKCHLLKSAKPVLDAQVFGSVVSSNDDGRGE